jgi:hypothetical protein
VDLSQATVGKNAYLDQADEALEKALEGEEDDLDFLITEGQLKSLARRGLANKRTLEGLKKSSG